MGSLSTVFSTDVMAILRCTELLPAQNITNRRIHIWYDSRTAGAALAKSTTESFLVSECMQSLGKLSELNKVTLVWIAWHQGMPGNEEADRLAKEGAIGVPPSQTAVMPISVDKKLIKRQLKLEHRFRWDVCVSCRQSKTLMG
jgi:ribonuclease HI